MSLLEKSDVFVNKTVFKPSSKVGIQSRHLPHLVKKSIPLVFSTKELGNSCVQGIGKGGKPNNDGKPPLDQQKVHVCKGRENSLLFSLLCLLVLVMVFNILKKSFDSKKHLLIRATRMDYMYKINCYSLMDYQCHIPLSFIYSELIRKLCIATKLSRGAVLPITRCVF